MLPKEKMSEEKMSEGTVASVGMPLRLFEADYSPPTKDTHSLLKEAMVSEWTKKIETDVCKTVERAVNNSVELQEEMHKHHLSLDEATAITYYTVDARKFGGKSENSPFYVLNQLLAKRHDFGLEKWKPFLFHLLGGLAKLPNFSGEVFRTINKSLTQVKQYKPNQEVVWVAFTSTSTDQNVANCFRGENEGTCMLIEVTEGKNICPFSIFQSECEILLPPNSSFQVVDVNSPSLRSRLCVSENIDAFHLKQTPTLLHLQLMQSLPTWSQLEISLAKIGFLTSQIDWLKNENTKLNSRIGILKEDNQSQITELNSQISLLKKENSLKISELSSLIAWLKKENTILNSQIGILKNENAQQISLLNTQIGTLKNENASQIAELKKEIASQIFSFLSISYEKTEQ